MTPPLFKDADGKPSLSFTMAYLAFLACLIWLSISIANLPHIRAFDVTAAAGFLTPLLTLYFGRRWTNANAPAGRGDEQSPPVTPPPATTPPPAV